MTQCSQCLWCVGTKAADADDVLMMRAIKTNTEINKNHQATTNLWAQCVFMCVLLQRLV